MVNKLIIEGAKFITKKAGGTIAKKSVNTLEYLDDRIGIGFRPLNIGEQETIDCYKKYPNTPENYCKSMGDKVRDNYHHPWRSKK